MGGKRISQQQQREIVSLREQGLTYADISRKTGVSATAIRAVTFGMDTPCALSEGELVADVDGYNGMYKVTSFGRVLSTGVGGLMREINVQQSKSGLRKVSLVVSGSRRSTSVFIDELVANAFVQRHDEGDVLVAHIDGDLSNDRADNLTWTSDPAIGNLKKSHVKKGASRSRKVGKHLSKEEVEEVRAKWLGGEQMTSLAAEFDVSAPTIYTCVRGLKRELAVPDCEPDERWADVPGYEGRYLVSSHGRVFSTGFGRRSPKFVKACPNSDGYMHLSLSGEDHSQHQYPVHRLVAMAFCDGRTKERDFVNHIDGNVQNNHSDNLEWCTSQENTRHAVDVLGREFGGNDQIYKRTRRLIPRDKTRPRSPLRLFSDDEIRAIRRDPRSSRAVAEEYGVNKCTIANILKGKTYRDI